MTAAHHLADRGILVLEREERVGGRTLSGQVDDYWYNLGAQYVWDPRTLQLCRELGLEVLDANGAKSALYLRGRLVRASNPYSLLLKMPLSLTEKFDFGRTIMRLRRLGDQETKLDASRLDAEPLSALVGKSSAITAEIIDRI